jgi:hypothetical protein
MSRPRTSRRLAGLVWHPVPLSTDRLRGLLNRASGTQATFRRLKLCHEPRCRVAFYDRSKNNSRVWHDTATCGNQVNSRAHRARRRQQSMAGPPATSNHEGVHFSPEPDVEQPLASHHFNNGGPDV